MMDERAAKLALARQKLKTHQEKKLVSNPKEESAIDSYNNVDNVSVKPSEFQVETIPQQPVTAETLPIKQSNEAPAPTETYNGSNTTINATEILVSSKRNLEMQVLELQTELTQLENNYTLAINNNNHCKQQISNLEYDYKILQDKYSKVCEEIADKDKVFREFNTFKTKIIDENNNLQEQLELAKSMLAAKESENAALHIELNNLQKQLDATQLQLQQLNNGSQTKQSHDKLSEHESTEHNAQVLLQKISNLELMLKNLQKEKDQLSSHYEHYVNELNEQLKSTVSRNHELAKEVQNLSLRENSLIEQIGDMEIRIQNMRQQPPSEPSKEQQIEEAKSLNALKELQQNFETLQVHFQKLNSEYQYLQQQYIKSEARVKELSETRAPETDHDTISISKLTADMASDKLAAQRATEQNRKMKIAMQELEEAFVKISRDKLDLTEKVAAEKYLNRELTIKLAEIDEKAKDMHTKLLAKDEEMIRLQNSYRELEKKILVDKTREEHESRINENSLIDEGCVQISDNPTEISGTFVSNSETECLLDNNKNSHLCLLEHNTDNNARIRKEDAMVKLQERFLKIMGEVADLSDEKHRLEHIILQLQNETDTICEYVALYQQQRSLLKKRDEERSAQIKLFQAECDLLKSQLEELSNILIRLAQDPELAVYFQIEPRQSDLAKVMTLLSNLKGNTLIDPHRSSSELNNFYPCSCCSGTLIEV